MSINVRQVDTQCYGQCKRTFKCIYLFIFIFVYMLVLKMATKKGWVKHAFAKEPPGRKRI